MNIRPETRFAASIHPEIFYALQVVSGPSTVTYGPWRDAALCSYPRSSWELPLPAGLWPIVADMVELEPTSDFKLIPQALRELPPRILQERALLGLFHFETAVTGLLDEKRPFFDVIAELPKVKREWLTFVGVYPFVESSDAARALQQLVKDPAGFRDALIETLQGFWNHVFSKVWQEYAQAYVDSAARMQQTAEHSTFAELIRHSLLPIEVDEKESVLRAIRGGAKNSIAELGPCTFVPSVFNEQRLWTLTGSPEPKAPWFPFVDPELMHTVGFAVNEPLDPALILRALGDTTRFALVSLLGRQPRTSVELAAMLSVSKPTISHHLHILRSAKLVHETSHGKSVLLSLRRQPIEQLSDLTVSRLFASDKPIQLSKSRRAQ